MMFEKNRKNVTYYYTPYGSLLIGIDAKSVDVQETENDIDVKVNYELEVNYEHMADCCITMNIKSKDAGDFRITGKKKKKRTGKHSPDVTKMTSGLRISVLLYSIKD